MSFLRYDGDDQSSGSGDLPVASPDDPRVTISGAERASEAVEHNDSILPHWTEAPTGQVPAVLKRDSPTDDDPWSTIPAPAWREGEADWVHHDEQFDPAMLTGEVPAVAPVDETRAWEHAEPPAAAPASDAAPPFRRERTRRPPAANPLAGRAARAKPKNLSLATVTGVIVALTVLIFFLWGTVPVMFVICGTLVLAAGEVYAAFRSVGIHPATLLGLVAVLALSIAAYNKGEVAIGLVTVLFMLFSVLWYMGAEKKVDILDGLGATLFVYVWLGVIGCYAALLISPVNYPNKHGLAFLIGAIIVTVANDVGALFTGRFIGRRPLAKSISPGKTVEGLIGGAAVGLAVALVVLPQIHPWTTRGAFVLAIALAIVTPIGDLFESLVKRTLGLKDMSDLLPGHGGMLDRVDGLLFALPTTYYLVHILHLG